MSDLYTHLLFNTIQVLAEQELMLSLLACVVAKAERFTGSHYLW